MDRRIFLALALAGLAPIAADAQTPPTPGTKAAAFLGASGDPAFMTWLSDFYVGALSEGFSKSLLDRELHGLSPDPSIGVADARQPEFAAPVSVYINNAISAGRIAEGRAKRDAIRQFPAIEATYGVPRDILIAVWAMESSFGAVQGDKDVIRSLATLAAYNARRRDWAEQELTAALRILAAGQIPRGELRGSWAGAMGQTQFIPSAYLSLAVDADGDGRKDIWNSPADALASAAHLLAVGGDQLKGGWRRGEGWAKEVILPKGFDYGLSEGPKEIPAWWQAKGVRRADGGAWSHADAAAPCTLILPSGAHGPAFLLLPNHFAIRNYNNSLAYALAVGLLADRFAGGGPLVTPWPHETPLSLSQRSDAQSALAKLGYDPGTPDGQIGAGTRAALRAWQKAQGLPADGYLSPDMVTRLRAAAWSKGPGAGHG